jgi:hypothetical protein
MTTKQFTSDLKLKAVHYYHKIKNYVTVCEILNVDRKTRKLGYYILEKQHIQFIKETLRKHSDIHFLQELLK